MRTTSPPAAGDVFPICRLRVTASASSPIEGGSTRSPADRVRGEREHGNGVAVARHAEPARHHEPGVLPALCEVARLGAPQLSERPRDRPAQQQVIASWETHPPPGRGGRVGLAVLRKPSTDECVEQTRKIAERTGIGRSRGWIGLLGARGFLRVGRTLGTATAGGCALIRRRLRSAFLTHDIGSVTVPGGLFVPAVVVPLLRRGTGVRVSKARVTALGFFDSVEINQKRGSTDDKMMLEVSVKEKLTGTFQVGFGFTGGESFFGQAQLAQNNLLGYGHTASLSLQISSIRQLFQLFESPRPSSSSSIC